MRDYQFWAITEPPSGSDSLNRQELRRQESEARRALNEQPNSLTRLTNLAQVLEKEGKLQAALYYWKCAANLDQSNLQSQLSVASLTADLGDLPSALKALRAINVINPQFEPATVEMAEVLCRLGDYGKGIEVLQLALTLDPTDPTARVSLGKALLSLNRYADASAAIAYYLTNHPADGEAHDLQGIAYLGEDKLSSAEVEFRKAYALDSRLPHLNRDLGAAILRQGRESEALIYLDRAIEEDPDNPDAHFFRMQVYKALERPDAAKAEVTRIAILKAKQVARDRILLLTSQAKALAEENRLTDALEMYRAALELDSHDGNVRYEAAIIEDSLGRLAEEERDLRQAETENPAAPATHNQLGTVAIRNGDYTEAKRELQLAIAESPNYYAAFGNLGVVYADLGDTQHAIECFERATELNPEYKQGFLNLGFMFSADGDFAEADRALHKLLEIDPSDPKAVTLRRAIAAISRPSYH